MNGEDDDEDTRIENGRYRLEEEDEFATGGTNPAVTILVPVCVIIFILIIMIVILKYYVKYIKKTDDERNCQRRQQRERIVHLQRTNSVAVSLPPPLFLMDATNYQLPLGLHQLEEYSEQHPLTPPPSSCVNNAFNFSSGTNFRFESNVIEPPLSSDDVVPNENSTVSFEYSQAQQRQSNLTRRDVIDPPSSSGDPYFNENLQQEQLDIGPPPPYTPRGVVAPPQEAYATTIKAPTYEESLDHAVV